MFNKPDLRPDQGAVLADQRGRQGHQVDAVRLDRPAVQPDQRGHRFRVDLRGPYPRPRPPAHDGDHPPGPRPLGCSPFAGDLPELQRLQRRCLRGDHGQGPARRDAHPARARPSPIRFGADLQHAVVMGSDGRLRVVEASEVGGRRHPGARRDQPGPGLPALAAVERARTRPTPIGVFRAVEASRLHRHRGQPPAGRRPRPQNTAPATSPPLLHSGATWTVD